MKEYTKEPRKPSEAAQESLPEDMIEGRNAVTEALRSGRTINKVFLADGDTDRALGRLAAMAKESGAVVVRVDRRKLNDMSPTGAHQGIMAAVAAHDYATVDDMLNAAQEGRGAPARHLRRAVRSAQPRCDHPHGRMRRRARRHHPPPPQRRPDGRRRQGLGRCARIYARGPRCEPRRHDPRSEGPRHLGVRHGSRRRHDPSPARTCGGPAAIVIGNEGSGMSRLVAESCDLKVSIPLKGPHFIPECLDGRRRAAV